MNEIDRHRGCLLGLAVADAVGTTLEFETPGKFEPLTDMVGGGPFNLKVGEWTDDTSMALCLADSLIERKGFDPVDQMERYYRWWKLGYLSSNGECFDIGGTTRTAMARFEESWEPYCGPTDPKAAGNGSIMRLAPIPMFYRNSPELARRAIDSSRTTHGAESCIDSCLFMSIAVAALLRGEDKNVVLSDGFAKKFVKEHHICPEVEEIVRGSYKVKEPPLINGDGYVIRTLEAALWAFHRTRSFKDGCLLVVNLGLDADTTGAVYGQFAGANYGVNDIPSGWLEKVVMRDKIQGFADKLYELGK